MERITIEVQDDGRVTVMAESPGEELEQMDFDSVDEAAGAVQELLMDAGEDAGEMAEEGEMDAAAMWDEEASKRPPQPNMMA
jgi:hypothetical protein